MIADTELRQSLVEAACRLNDTGLNQGTAGNLSVRVEQEAFLITPSALAYEKCQAEDIVRVGLSGEIDGGRKPSSEWQMHRDLYLAYPQAGSVLHTHSTWSTVLACLEKAIPPFHYMVAVAGGDTIPCAPYAPFGTKELSDGLLAAIEGRRACLLAHHGLVCFADTLEGVMELAVEVETLAKMYVQILQVAEPPLLSAEQMEDVLARFAAYKS